MSKFALGHIVPGPGGHDADGFTGFNGLFGEGRAKKQASMVHVRRKFVEVFERDGSVIARGAIERIARLHAVEKEARYNSPDERVIRRQAKARPIFDELEHWLKLQLPKISGKTKLAEAIRYAQRWSRKFGPVVKVDRMTRETTRNDKEKGIRPLSPL